MKRVKRKEGKREWEAERAADGVDCKIGSDAHTEFIYDTVWILNEDVQNDIYDNSPGHDGVITSTRLHVYGNTFYKSPYL